PVPKAVCAVRTRRVLPNWFSWSLKLIFWLLRKKLVSVKLLTSALFDQVFEPLQACEVGAKVNELGKLGQFQVEILKQAVSRTGFGCASAGGECLEAVALFRRYDLHLLRQIED